MNFYFPEYNDKSINKSGIILFTKIVTLEIIEECRKRNARLLGIDGFFDVDGTRVRSSISNSIDFSRHSYKLKTEEIYSDAIQFVQSSPTEYFEIVIAEY